MSLATDKALRGGGTGRPRRRLPPEICFAGRGRARTPSGTGGAPVTRGGGSAPLRGGIGACSRGAGGAALRGVAPRAAGRGTWAGTGSMRMGIPLFATAAAMRSMFVMVLASSCWAGVPFSPEPSFCSLLELPRLKEGGLWKRRLWRLATLWSLVVSGDEGGVLPEAGPRLGELVSVGVSGERGCLIGEPAMAFEGCRMGEPGFTIDLRGLWMFSFTLPKRDFRRLPLAGEGVGQ
mmetsp:Transcript_11026/g.45008  ORF Transcript_11026/g.45008 Transcript_11026/m.45008 type:complete len:235 (-) Transcript_11026:212-916(-)